MFKSKQRVLAQASEPRNGARRHREPPRCHAVRTAHVAQRGGYAVDDTDRLFSANTGTGQISLIGHMYVRMVDIAENPQKQLFGIDASDFLYRINATTAAVTRVGSLGTTDVSSLAFLISRNALWRIRITLHDQYLDW